MSFVGLRPKQSVETISEQNSSKPATVKWLAGALQQQICSAMKENIRVISFTLLTYNSDLRQRGSQYPNSARPRIHYRTTAKKNNAIFFLAQAESLSLR